MEQMLKESREMLNREQRNHRVVKVLLLYREAVKEILSRQKKDIFTKRIGNTTYQVRVFFDKDSTEPVSDKLMHLIHTEIAGMTAERSIYE